ncbi:SusC/RagA family TonB-linked outer membrane protein [Sphingobacterium daejeonense]|uniref:SusC/RagA family TonB-linked outer membrane protein n=2 Tax=Sphingobacterium daejeonense TaxID=371142 RepID=UPI0021A7A7E1|nr:SusC/RagA family TonB-linked outer membrane protein [Sphingobacterium daejeonense]MCT1529707.1 SusC/RagA family TonB-linked outer membrane protein [Sphingobacterium daejeonense]
MSVLWKFKSLLIFMSMSVGHAHSHNANFSNLSLQDTTETDSVPPPIDTLAELKPIYELDLPKFNNLRNMKGASLITANSLQQYIKGELPGVYVSESNGEPGTNIQMFVRGISKPILSNRDIYASQPLVVMDGVPLIGEHPFAFDIQNYDIERIGTENNLLSNIDFDNIESIKVLKDLSAVAIYGPLAANGVIEITSRKTPSDGQKRISINSYIGMSQRPNVTTINGAYENAFRKQFYDLYTTNGRFNDDDVYPIYLSDSLNNDYYGPSNWSDSYYQNGLNHGVNANIAGGQPRATFQFSLGNVKTSGVADDTKFDKYNARFYLNLRPFKWLNFETLFNAARISRDRNRNLRNRFAMMGYFPDLGAPLAPNKDVYDTYLQEFDKSFDKNFNNILEGFFRFQVNVGPFKLKSKFGVDYNEGYRDLFYPSTILENSNFASNYYGYNQRLMVDNQISYDKENGPNYFYAEVGNNLVWDTYKYNYAYAYKGVNDFIKLNLLETDPYDDEYLNPTAFPRQLVYKFLDRTKHNMINFYGKASYTYNGSYTAALTLRYDGSSNAQPTSRWFFSPILALGWNAKNDLMKENEAVSLFNIRASVGRIGHYNLFDNYSQGPSYSAQVGYTGNSIVPGYNGIAVLVRPYDVGWVGYDLPWSYSDNINIGFDLGFKNRNIQFSLDAYIRDTKDQLIMLPGKKDFGYQYQYESGMDVRNMGIDLSASGNVIQNDKVTWNTGIVLGVNTNKLLALPFGYDQIEVNDRLLKIGERIDAFWLYENNGMYQTDQEVPESSGQKMTYNGIVLKAGDPIWNDSNGDNQITKEDKVIQGNIIPKLSGSWNNMVAYRNFDLNLNFYFNLGRKIVNQEMANRFNFIENENASSINSIKEITYWEKRGDYDQYPLYNPWSSVSPFQTNQTLFLEDGSFLKLRTASIGYNFKDIIGNRLGKLGDLYVYISANNLLTLSKYSGRDPELVNYMGYDQGYSLPIPRTYALGFKLKL